MHHCHDSYRKKPVYLCSYVFNILSHLGSVQKFFPMCTTIHIIYPSNTCIVYLYVICIHPMLVSVLVCVQKFFPMCTLFYITYIHPKLIFLALWYLSSSPVLYELSYVVRKWAFGYMQTTKLQESLCISVVSPEILLLAFANSRP